MVQEDVSIRYGKEVRGDDHFAMIGQESQPPLARITAASDAFQIARHRVLGHFKAQLQEFS
jgi:hypothetical protein